MMNRTMTNRIVIAALTVALCCAGTATALAAAQTTRVRGTVESVSGHTLALKTYAGKTERVHWNAKTKFAWVVPADIKDVTPNTFVGIAATGPTGDLRATELVIFPNSMRGMGEGHYAWSMPAAVAAADAHEGASAAPGAPPVHGTMTNGTVSSAGTAAGTNGPPVQGTMTNGTVSKNASASSGRKLTISYDHGQHVGITVPAGIPVVRFVPASQSVVKSGAKTFLVAARSNGGLTAGFVAVGKNGLMPPM